MSCNSRKTKGGSAAAKGAGYDKLFKGRLVALAYCLVLLAVAMAAFFAYPQYVYHTVASMFALTLGALVLAAKTLQAAEATISYSGFVFEVLKDAEQMRRIDDAKGEPIVQNTAAEGFFAEGKVLDALEERLSENRGNAAAMAELKTARGHLREKRAELAVKSGDAGAGEEWLEVCVRPVYIKKADIFEGPFSVKAIKKNTCFLWSIRDITARKNMDKVFGEERKYLNDFIDDLAAGLFVCDKNYAIEYANHALAAMLGVDRDAIAGRNLKEFLAMNERLPEKEKKFAGVAHFVDAKRRALDCWLAQDTFRQNQQIKTRGVIVPGLPNDEALRASLHDAVDKVGWLFNFAPVGIVFSDRDGKIANSNMAAQLFFGLSADKLNGSSVFDHCSEEDAEALAKELAFVAGDRNLTSKLDLRVRKGREERDATIHINPMRRFYGVAGEQSEGFVLHIVDATEHKTLELQFAQAQKMQAMGQLAGGIAHDFNNLLTAMIGFCDLLLQRHGVGDPSFVDLMQIRQNANRATSLVRQLLAFSRKQPLKPKLINVAESFADLSDTLRRSIGGQVSLKFHFGDDVGFVKVDPVQFSQVIINLAVNAKDAMDGRGELHISTAVEALREDTRFGEIAVPAGEFAVISVRDTGCGIPKENLTRIFDPFFTTKGQNPAGSGTGLGLSMVYGIVHQAGGFIKVDSAVGKGTTFSIHLPRFERGEPGEVSAAEVPGNFDAKGVLGLNIFAADSIGLSGGAGADGKALEGARILFVDDEDSVRAFGVKALKKKGFDVIGCASAENALEILADDKDFRLLITDMMMPGMSGAELAAEVRQMIPGAKVILASGYSEEITMKDMAGSADFAFMAKPFSLGDLTKKVAEVLNG